jgi:hypothetical protein
MRKGEFAVNLASWIASDRLSAHCDHIASKAPSPGMTGIFVISFLSYSTDATVMSDITVQLSFRRRGGIHNNGHQKESRFDG